MAESHIVINLAERATLRTTAHSITHKNHAKPETAPQTSEDANEGFKFEMMSAE